MKDFLKILVIRTLYSCEIERRELNKASGKYRWTFKFKPRIFPHIIFCTLATIPFMIWGAYTRVFDLWEGITYVIDYSTFQIRSKEKPSKNACAKRF